MQSLHQCTLAEICASLMLRKGSESKRVSLKEVESSNCACRNATATQQSSYSKLAGRIYSSSTVEFRIF